MSWWWRAVGSRAPRTGVIIQRAARLTLEPLERRAFLSAGLTFAHDTAESEPNNTITTANVVTVSTTPNLVSGTITTASDVDYFKFTLGARSGVFLDLDGRETGLDADLDSVLRVYNSAG